MDNQTLSTFLAVAVLLWFVTTIVFVILQHRDKADLLGALTDAVANANANTKALDLLEPMATKVVPLAAIKAFNQGADLIETFTPDQADALIEQIRKLANQLTDGKANTSGADQTNKQVVQG